MPATTMTPELAHAAGTDAANRQMREAGRTAWSVEDYNLAAETRLRLMREYWLVHVEFLERIRGE